MDNQRNISASTHTSTSKQRPPSPPSDSGPPPEKSASPDFLSLHDSPHRDSGGHISISPPPGNSPARSSSISSDPTNVSEVDDEKPHLPERRPPATVVNRDVSQESRPVVNRVFIDQPLAVVEKTDSDVRDQGKGELGGRSAGGGGSGPRRFRPSLSILRRAKREKMVKKAALGFRVFGFLFCLVSFGVMAADRNQGWALDSFERYIEFRYSISVNVIGFVYSGAQALDLSYNLATGKYIVQHQQQLRYYFDFAFDQIVAYLLISASSSAVTRIDDWQSNWGKDKFPDMATASVSMSFLAFVALASSSLISGYALCTSKSV